MRMTLPLLIISTLAVSEGTWDPYCPWETPGIDKQLYSCSNNSTKSSHTKLFTANRAKIKVGLLLPQVPADCTYIDLFNQGIAAEIAVEDINSNPDLLPGYELELVNASDYKSCGRSFDTLGYAYTLRVKAGADVLIGPACGDGNSGSSVASFAAAENVPVISVASFQDDLNDVAKYPTFTRLYESTEIQAYYHAGVYQYFGWKEIVTIVQKEVNPACTAKWANLTRTLKLEMGYTKIKSFSLLPNNTLSTKNITTILEENRIVSIFGSPSVVRNTVLEFYRVCNNNSWCTWSNYRFIAVNFQIGFVVSNEQILPWRCDQSLRKFRELCSCCTEEQKRDDEEARLAFKSVIYIVSNVPKFSQQDDLFCKLMKKLKDSPYIEPKKKARCIEQVFLIQHLYDTVLVYAYALNITNNPADGKGISEEFKRLTNIEGKSGRIITNSQGSRYSEMLAYFFQEGSDQEMTAKLKLSPTRDTGLYTAFHVDGQRPPIKIPDKHPCKWHDFTCEGPLSTLIAGVFVVIISIVGGTICRIWITQRKSIQQSFFITTEQLEGFIEANTNATDKHFLPVSVQRTDIKVSATDKSTTALLRGLNQVHHNNIVQLLHCCLDTTGMTMVLEDCPKGPLQYLIRTEQRVKTASFIRSFAADILSGLSYLNGSTFSYHGSLTSLNCVVDANWNVKLKGFYLRQIQNGEIYTNHEMEMKAMNTARQVYDGLWMSPQFHKGEITDASGFQENDIYSFGVILAELVNGEPPFGIFFDERIDVKILHDQIELIKSGEKPLTDEFLKQQSLLPSYKSSISSKSSLVPDGGSIASSSGSSRTYQSQRSSRPTSRVSSNSTLSYASSAYLDEDDLEDDLTMVKQFCLLCIEDEPEDRPTVREILERLETGSQSNIGSLVDQWLVTLEKKSKELKEKFDLKNKDLFKEKEKTKELVYSLLPREIAEQKMRCDAAIPPQEFSNCSFFYSDIKGFTSIVADLTNLEDGGPMDVVGMLDNLYTIMDKAIGKHNVVKIETIGDAYVVVSGLPVPDINGSAHARHIAAFALDVLSTTKDITVPRLNNRPVYMRIGIHSGSCVAGVAGNYMYHYCIYGKEPRYANNLESSGEANRIHMSDDMRKILEKNFQHQFSIVERKPSCHISGFKSKSNRTWWLTGESGVQRDMPKEDIYKKLEFKRKISSTANPKLLIKGVAKLRNDATNAHMRTHSECSDKSAKKFKKDRSGSISDILTVGSKAKKDRSGSISDILTVGSKAKKDRSGSISEVLKLKVGNKTNQGNSKKKSDH